MKKKKNSRHIMCQGGTDYNKCKSRAEWRVKSQNSKANYSCPAHLLRFLSEDSPNIVMKIETVRQDIIDRDYEKKALVKKRTD